MMSGPNALRLRLKPATSATGYVDGGWWPHSRDLAAELPALAHALGSVRRVVFTLDAWDAAPRRVEVDGYPVRLEGFRSQDDNIVHVTGADRRRISLLVIPPGSTGAVGHKAMTTAGQRDNTDSPATILAQSRVVVPNPRKEVAGDGQARWKLDGGHMYERG